MCKLLRHPCWLGLPERTEPSMLQTCLHLSHPLLAPTQGAAHLPQLLGLTASPASHISQEGTRALVTALQQQFDAKYYHIDEEDVEVQKVRAMCCCAASVALSMQRWSANQCIVCSSAKGGGVAGSGMRTSSARSNPTCSPAVPIDMP
jgi:hypothetical protein